jgi:N-acetyl-gamma-glutamyl-phosphate reductase
MIKAGIIGGAGYAGGELIRLLVNHPDVNIEFIHSSSNAGNWVNQVHEDMLDVQIKFIGTIESPIDNIDVLFLCLGHGQARKFLDANPVAASVRIIDLSQDFRLQEQGTSGIGNRKFIYGLPELHKPEIQTAHDISNPGCFATAIQLGLLPLAAENLLETTYSTGITGSTGAGHQPSDTTHFSWRANNVQAYKTLTHQHLQEIQQTFHQLQPAFPAPAQAPAQLHFVPWRGDFPRGIFISSTLSCALTLTELNTLYQDYYKDAPFTFVCRQPIHLKQVVNTNNCVLHLEKVGTKLVVHSAIDNLLKGASGQAVQNMNLLFGMEETTGLQLKANYF